MSPFGREEAFQGNPPQCSIVGERSPIGASCYRYSNIRVISSCRNCSAAGVHESTLVFDLHSTSLQLRVLVSRISGVSSAGFQQLLFLFTSVAVAHNKICLHKQDRAADAQYLSPCHAVRKPPPWLCCVDISILTAAPHGVCRRECVFTSSVSYYDIM